MAKVPLPRRSWLFAKDRPQTSVGFLPLSEVALGPLHAGLVLAHTGEEQELTPQHPLGDGALVSPGLRVDEAPQQPDEKGLREAAVSAVLSPALSCLTIQSTQVRGNGSCNSYS